MDLQHQMAVLTCLMAVVYVYSMVRTQSLLTHLKGQAGFGLPWSGRKKFMAIKEFVDLHRGTELEQPAKKLLFYMNVSVYTVYIGFVVAVLLMVTQA